MLKIRVSLVLLSRRHQFPLKYRYSQILSQKRCFSSKDDNDGNSKQNDSLPEMENVSKKSSESKIQKQALPDEKSKEAAKKKLFSLLSEMTIVSDKPRTGSDLKLAKPLKRPSKQERFKDVIEQNKKTPEDEIQKAAEKVATSVKGDPEKTLSELNEKLRKLNLAKSSAKASDAGIDIDEEMGKNLMASVKDIASTVADGSPPVRSKLTQRLLKLSVEGKSSDTPKASIDKLVKGMKVEKTPVSKKYEPIDLQRRQQPIRPSQTPINLFDAPPLDIFKLSEEPSIETKKTVWQTLEAKNLKLLTQYAPANGFEEMIMWTEQGKHWEFPINNQRELGEEENVGFHEHVFLEQHLHGFPTKGPVRHFMELVAVGLSKNPYISVDRKVENINWFRDYFKEKEDILKASGVLA
ncbi:28S ribosomal protein S31, mitochondrial [Trichonephila clavata]|uniref:Small ribosomal subunit protein mS31 n=1 Tax=Trichonephila clavata TaxID=2740835 RepID=A0A8X6LY70_TRICU|nr:28S ribosomal protein S31, mitochondrial [Trichonephila clavata]